MQKNHVLFIHQQQTRCIEKTKALIKNLARSFCYMLLIFVLLITLELISNITNNKDD